MIVMSEQAKITDQSGRLDKVAAQLFANYSRSQLQHLIVAGDLLVNGPSKKQLNIKLRPVTTYY
jgi:23S rRNA pseudouridine1911/1915/1917 synthase